MRFLGKEVWLEESAAGDGIAGREMANTGAANTGAANTGAANTGAANTGAASTGAASTGAASTGTAGGGAAGDTEAFGFCGIHVISTRIFDLGYEEGFSDIFEIYRSAMEGGEWIAGYRMDCYWSDLGTAARIRDFEKRIGGTPL